ncbi:hypothetical protein QBC47DRAFT_124328 [Echria macrotheca]|uniref:Uncharacterized protein n=1 Tax=Echria macrotheca TaxID=438768 RepID=A0AAJ0F1T3_9PEZI|nr:hypothetical protein QBC47DRAFT_124328 [Echria macrotheca]
MDAIEALDKLQMGCTQAVERRIDGLTGCTAQQRYVCFDSGPTRFNQLRLELGDDFRSIPVRMSDGGQTTGASERVDEITANKCEMVPADFSGLLCVREGGGRSRIFGNLGCVAPLLRKPNWEEGGSRSLGIPRVPADCARCWSFAALRTNVFALVCFVMSSTLSKRIEAPRRPVVRVRSLVQKDGRSPTGSRARQGIESKAVSQCQGSGCQPPFRTEPPWI